MDISIKNLKKYVFEPKTESLRLKRATEILSQDMVITEKVDGTKLTLVRTENTDKVDYTKNWVVAYKGTVLYAKEFAHIGSAEKGDITSKSVGIAQYSLVFDHLKSINSRISSIPASTEFSVEFAQNKDTLTRTYINKGGMFLRSYGKVEYRVMGGNLYTKVVGEEVTDYAQVKKMADLLEISSFPVLHTGKLSKENLLKNPLVGPKMNRVDWNNPFDVLTKFSEAVLAVPSSLGGKSEGVVLKMANGEFYKLVQDDQYDAEVRGAKKELYKLEPEAATAYFQQIRALIEKVFSVVGTDGKTEEDIISDTNFYIAKHENELSKFFGALQKIAGDKKNMVQIKDDIHDTIRLLTSKESLLGKKTASIGLIPIAGKPLHIGHWKLIEKAASENARVVVYTSTTDRVKKGEFPIYGDDFIKIWSDIYVPALPKNVKVKFVDSPVRSVMHEIAWYEQRFVQDAMAAPIINLYSDKDDIDVNFKDEDLAKYPALMQAGKIKKIGVPRTSTVNVSGTKMREFLQNNDKDSFVKYLPPVSKKDKENIWNILISHGQQPVKEVNPYALMAEELIGDSYEELISEGGWRSKNTQSTVITPKKVSTIMSAVDEFVSAFNRFSKLPPIKNNGPVGSAMYYKQDMSDQNVTYGDIDVQIVLPVETNDRAKQLEADKMYAARIKQFIEETKPSYIVPEFDEEDYGFRFLVFKIDGENVQVDLVISYKISADWAKVRTTPEKGLKGFVTGTLLSALSAALNVVMSANTNPYINTVNGRPVSSAVKKGSKAVFLKPNELFLEVLKFYSRLAGLKPNADRLKGYYGLDPVDPSLKKKCEAVVHLADALEDSGVFAKGVITSKTGVTFKTRNQFVKFVLDTFIKSMELAKTAKKLEKATTPEAMQSVEKLKKHADIGTEIAKQLIREEILLMESGQSVASVDDKTPKMVDKQLAQATTKLKIVDPKGNDIRSSVSADVKELVYALNDKVHFWKKNSPYIENGFVFNGSSQYLMSGDEKYKDLAKYKSGFGDIDVIVPKEKLDALEAYLDKIDDRKVDWKPTPQNKVSKNFHYVGRTKSQRALAGQTVTLWYYLPVKQVVQIDFEGDEMTLDPQGFEKPSEWNKFIKDSPWEDLTLGVKGLAGAILLRGLTRAATALPNAVYVTNAAASKIQSGQIKSLVDAKGKSIVSTNVTHALPAAYTLNTSGSGHAGVRKAYRLVAKNMDYAGKKVDVYTDIPASESKPEDRITSVPQVFELIFKRKPSQKDLTDFRSYVGLLRLMKTLPKDVQVKAMERTKEGLAQAGLSPEEYAPIQKAAKSILGITI